MLLSALLEMAGRVGGPRFARRVLQWRMERWRNFEAEYYMLDQLADRERIAIDVGGNEGLYAGRLAQLCPAVHCFEPIPWFASQLRQVLPDSVTVHECAASNRDGTAMLRIPYRGEVEMHGTSTLEPDNTLEGSTHVREVPCRLVRLDDVVREPVGFLKIDVEGHELAVLEGADRILRDDRPVLLIESEARHSPGAPHSVFHHLEARGYVGCFMMGGRPRQLREFDIDAHQKSENAMKRGMTYINNFIFF